MRYFAWTGVVAVASLLSVSGARVQAQTGGEMGGQSAAPRTANGGFAGVNLGARGVQGIVTAVSASKLTIKTAAGDSYDVTLTDSSRIMENRQAIKLTDIKPGDSVMAMGQIDATAKTVQAMMVNATDAATIAKAKENLGKTYITGKITAVDADNLKLTVMRMDNVSQVIAVDDGTSFQRGMRGVAADVTAAGGLAMGGGFGGGRGMGGGWRGDGPQAAPPAPESITLADIKAGDSIMATGVMKGGAFTALKMGVATPGAGPGAGGGARRRGQQDPGVPQGSAPQSPVATPQ